MRNVMNGQKHSGKRITRHSSVLNLPSEKGKTIFINSSLIRKSRSVLQHNLHKESTKETIGQSTIKNMDKYLFIYIECYPGDSGTNLAFMLLEKITC